MWIWSLLLLSLSGGILGNNEEVCRDGLRKVCYTQEFNGFPKTEEDLEEFCPLMLERLICVQDFQNKCGAEDETDVESIEKVILYMNELCREGSKLRADFLKEVPCMKNVLQNRGPECRNLTDQAMDEYEAHRGVIDLENPDVEYHKSKYCFFQLHAVACLLAELDRDCGASAETLAFDATHRMSIFDKVCSSETYEDLLKLIDFMQIQIGLRDLVRDIILLNKRA